MSSRKRTSALDLGAWAASVAFDDSVDRLPSVHGDDGDPYESALMNALGGVKAVLRDQPDLAREGLSRALDRLAEDSPLHLPTRERIIAVTQTVATRRPHLAAFAAAIADAARRLP